MLNAYAGVCSCNVVNPTAPSSSAVCRVLVGNVLTCEGFVVVRRERSVCMCVCVDARSVCVCGRALMRAYAH
eukprot:3652008-Pyramimonas_sp.AAC.1